VDARVVSNDAVRAHHVTRHNTPIHNFLSTAPQLSISQKALETLLSNSIGSSSSSSSNSRALNIDKQNVTEVSVYHTNQQDITSSFYAADGGSIFQTTRLRVRRHVRHVSWDDPENLTRSYHEVYTLLGRISPQQ
jgi:hypothetical protein